MEYRVQRWRPDGPDRDRTIDLLEVVPGPRWVAPSEVAIRIMNQTDRFYVLSPRGERIYLEAQGSALSRFWVRTTPNGIWDDNLYQLPKF